MGVGGLQINLMRLGLGNLEAGLRIVSKVDDDEGVGDQNTNDPPPGYWSHSWRNTCAVGNFNKGILKEVVTVCQTRQPTVILEVQYAIFE